MQVPHNVSHPLLAKSADGVRMIEAELDLLPGIDVIVPDHRPRVPKLHPDPVVLPGDHQPGDGNRDELRVVVFQGDSGAINKDHPGCRLREWIDPDD